MDLEKINLQLREKTPDEIISWALGLDKRVFATTSFGPNAAVMLKLIAETDSSIPVVWVDSGYNVRDTYMVAEQLMNLLPLNMHIYTPEMTAERRNALMGGVPSIDDEELHQEFTRQVKLDPFRRAIEAINPQIWLTGIRKGETEHRKNLDVVSIDNRGLIKVAPIFYWTDADVSSYMEQHQLPSCKRYFDPTKVHENRECGLHTAA
jgi:phosphoadenosine phosphosulfate reductase